MKSLLTSLLLLISLTAFSQAAMEQALTQQNWNELQGTQYAISHPTDWEADKSNSMTEFILLSPASGAEDLFRENVNLIIQDLSAYDMNLDQFTELSLEQVKTMITDSKIIHSGKEEKNGQTFHQLVYTGAQGQYSLKFKQYYWVVNKKAYILTFTAEVDEYDSFEKTANKILNSFNLKQE